MRIDFEYNCGWNRHLLNFGGFWPRHQSNYIGKYWPLINAMMVLIVIIIPRFAAMSLFWNELDAFVQSFPTQLAFISVFFKLIVLQFGNKVLIELLSTMEANLSVKFTKEHYTPVIRAAKIARTISIIVGLSFVCVVITGVISLKLYHLDSLYIKNPDPRLSTDFIFVAYIPFDTTSIISYITILLLQLYITVMSTGIHLILDSFVVMLILHVCGELEIIGISLTHLGEDINNDRDESFQVALREIVIKHQKICQYVRKNSIFFLAHVFGIIVKITVSQGYNALKLLYTDKFGLFEIGFLIFSTSGILIQFFLNCWAGECLVSQSSEVGYALYCCQWYRLSASDVHSLMMIGHQRTRPLTLTTWKFSILSMALFLQVIKTSFSYLSVLLVMRDFQEE